MGSSMKINNKLELSIGKIYLKEYHKEYYLDIPDIDYKPVSHNQFRYRFKSI